MQADDWDVPEFVLPAIMECNCILPLREQDHITSAARYAHNGQDDPAEWHRAQAGYSGLTGHPAFL